MSTIVEASVPTEEFVLSETLERLRAVEFNAISLVSNGIEHDMPLLWATGADAPVILEALQADETTASAELLSRRENHSLFDIRWVPQARFVTDVLVDQGGALLGAHGTVEGWRFRILFPERTEVSETYTACSEFDVSIDSIQSLTEPPLFDQSQITDTQFRTLETALERGYYRVPREVSIEEVAAEFGVSHQAISERFRRGHRTLVELALGL